ncbi:MAG: hypothetical protein ACREF3_13760 [Acetobacteraceae bacterium]
MESEAWDNGSAGLTHLYALIGSIASGWSHIENAVDVTLWKLMGVDAKLGACVTSQIQSLAYRLFALASIVKLRGCSKETTRSLNKFIAQADKLSRDRNRAIHDPISAGGEIKSITITARHQLVYCLSPDTRQQYEKTDSDIANLLGCYLDLEKRIFQELENQVPLPPKRV